jgi:hypothetical protein
LKYVLGALVLLVVADGVVTNILIKNEIAWEGNPIMKGLAGGSGLIIVKIAGVLAAALILWDIRRRYPRLAFWTGVVFILIYAAIVAWNTRLLIMG